MTPRIVATLALSLVAGAMIACSSAPASPAPAQPPATAIPAAPSQPAVPAESIVSIQPIAPAILAALVEPIAPVMPAQPSNPVAPVGPAAPVEIEAPAIATITGTVAYRERIALTPDSVVEIKLIDVSRMDAPAITIGEQIIVSPGQVPIAFEIEYNPAEIDDRFSYAVQARITQSGKLAFINDTRYSVITRGGPTNVDMVLTKVATSPAQPPDPVIPAMTEKRAPIESVELTTSDSNPREYTLHIVSGLPGGCVKFGDYSVAREGAHIDVAVTNFAPTEPLPCTMMYGIHEGEVELGSDFTAGETYMVSVNGNVTNAFTAQDEGPKTAMADSPIERVDVVVSESDPTAYILQVVSRLPKGSSCSWFNGYDVARPYAGVIDVTVTHFEVTEMMPCTADLPVVSTEIPLGTDFAPNQAYRVTVNGAAITSFTARDLEGPEAVIADSPVEHIEVVAPQTESGAYTLNVVSQLPKGSSCSWFNGYSVSRPYNGAVDVRVTHYEVTGMMPCTADLPIVETEIPLGDGFVAGETYTVTVNGDLSETFAA